MVADCLWHRREPTAPAYVAPCSLSVMLVRCHPFAPPLPTRMPAPRGPHMMADTAPRSRHPRRCSLKSWQLIMSKLVLRLCVILYRSQQVHRQRHLRRVPLQRPGGVDHPAPQRLGGPAVPLRRHAGHPRSRPGPGAVREHHPATELFTQHVVNRQ